MPKYLVSDIDLDFDARPTSDIYTAFYDKEMIVDVPDDIIDVEDYIAQVIREDIEVEFDTPNEPYYEVSDANFYFEKLDDEIENDDPAVDLYVEQSQMERS